MCLSFGQPEPLASASSATFPPAPFGHNSCPWNGNEEVGGGSLNGIGAAETGTPLSPSSGLRDRKKDEDAVGSAENEAEEGEEVLDESDDGSLEWAELLLSTRQVL